MSGVAAVLHLDGSPALPEPLARMAASIAPRGEDGLDIWHEAGVGLAHAHFWTTPEEVGERQPIGSHDGRLHVCADLRLDNRDELCARLGHVVDSRHSTDAEILLASYDRWEEKCTHHLVGDFAFLLWDTSRQRLFFARDPLGVRPLYYSLSGRRLAAASTLEAVLAAGEQQPSVNEPFLRDLLAWRFERWLDETPYQGVFRLPPSHQMLVQNGRAALSRYWTLGAEPLSLRRDEDYVERFREILFAAVRSRLRSASPVGIMVSGGIDSSTIACVAEHLAETEALDAESRLYSCVFEKTPGAEERLYAEAVARRCTRARMTWLVSDDCWGLREFAGDRDYPLIEPEIGINRALMLRPLRSARTDGCRSVLTGIGGDQALGGEPYHRPGLLRDVSGFRLFKELPHFRRYSRKGSGALFADAWLRPVVPPVVRRLIRRLRRSEGQSGMAEPERSRSLLPPPPLSSRSAQLSYRQLTAGAFSARLSFLSVAAATEGIEVRLPYLDRRVIDFLLAAPARLRFQNGWIKLILRLALPGILPEPVRTRTGFAYFSELEQRGLKARERSRVQDFLIDSRVVKAGLASEGSLRSGWENYWKSPDKVLLPRPMVGFLCAEAWLRAREQTPAQASPTHDRLVASVAAGA